MLYGWISLEFRKLSLCGPLPLIYPLIGLPVFWTQGFLFYMDLCVTRCIPLTGLFVFSRYVC